MFGLKMPHIAGGMQARPALNMPGLRRGSMPGINRGAMMPKLLNNPQQQQGGYGDVLRQNIMAGLKQPKR